MLGGVVLATVAAFVVGVPVGLGLLAAVLAVAAVWRAAASSPGPAGITVRSKVFDVALFGGFAAALIFLAVTTPKI